MSYFHRVKSAVAVARAWDIVANSPAFCGRLTHFEKWKMYFGNGAPLQKYKIWLKTQNLPHFDLQELATMLWLQFFVFGSLVTPCWMCTKQREPSVDAPFWEQEKFKATAKQIRTRTYHLGFDTLVFSNLGFGLESSKTLWLISHLHPIFNNQAISKLIVGGPLRKEFKFRYVSAFYYAQY